MFDVNKEEIYFLSNPYSGVSLFRFRDNQLMLLETNQGYYFGKIELQESSSRCKVEPGEDLSEALFQNRKYFLQFNFGKREDVSLKKLEVVPGDYHPRIYRPVMQRMEQHPGLTFLSSAPFSWDSGYCSELPFNINQFHLSINQLSTIKEMLLSILNNVYPTDANLGTYGHNIRNLLIISCIEVENQLKGILVSNSNSNKQEYSTKDYVKLKKYLRLEEYSIQLSHYPESKVFKPFENWDIKQPSKSLKWYDSYNGAKHNSYEEFDKASLENVLSAVCAVAILLIAQYSQGNSLWDEHIGSFFKVVKSPQWKLNECYLPPFSGGTWAPVKIGL